MRSACMQALLDHMCYVRIPRLDHMQVHLVQSRRDFYIDSQLLLRYRNACTCESSRDCI